MGESWRYISGFIGIYKVSDLGAIYSCRRARLLHPHKDADGYLRIGLWDGERQRKFSVHRLVALAFLADRQNALHREVAHLDGNPSNCRVTNLKWVGKVENHSHKRLHGTHQAGEMHPRAKLTEAQVIAIRRDKRGYGLIAADYEISWHSVSDIRRRVRWRHVA